MPFTTKTVLPVLPKPDHIVGSFHSRQLSAIEDKELRKKLRNRQSALAARERKKARMLELERKVAELQLSNKMLESENLKLRRTLNEIIRSAASSGVRYLTKPCTTVTPYYFAKSAEEANALENCGGIDPVSNTKTGVISKTTNFIPGQLSNTVLNYKTLGTRKNTKDNTTVVTAEFSESNMCIDDQNPIDYSINSDRSNSRKNVFASSGTNRKLLKTQDELRKRDMDQVNNRENDVPNMSTVQNFHRNSFLSSETDSVTVKKEAMTDVVFAKNEGNINVPPADQSPSENDSPFARALKRRADSMLSSASFATTRLNNESRMADAHPMKSACKKKQALPSIDAVFYSQSKPATLISSDLSELERHSQDKVEKYLENSTCSSLPANHATTEALPNRNSGERPLFLVKSPPISSRPKRDPYLHQHSETTNGNVVYNPTRIFSDVSDTSVILLPSELSSIMTNFSNGRAGENDDVLGTVYDDPGNSPLESVSSRDSGLGVEEDPLDWIPDASFFDF